MNGNKNNTPNGAKSMGKKIAKADILVNLAKCKADSKAWHRAGLACRAVANNTRDLDLAEQYQDLYETCSRYARHYR
jgi:hypothetical protein